MSNDPLELSRLRSKFLISNVWKKPQRSNIYQLDTDSSNYIFTIDFSSSSDFSLTLKSSIILDKPSNVVAGQSGLLIIYQNPFTAYDLSYNSFWKFPEGSDQSISTVLSSINILTYYTISSDIAACNLIKNIS